MPVWVAAVEDGLHVYTSRGTRKARNLAAEPRVVIHLPDPEDVLIVEGSLRDTGHPTDRPGRGRGVRGQVHGPR